MQQTDNHYDGIVIGSGLGGLTAAALLAQQGKRLLVLERHDKYGGAASQYRRQRLKVEVSLEAIDGFDDFDSKLRVWQQLHLDTTVERISDQNLYSVKRAHDQPPMALEKTTERLAHQLSQLYPDQALPIAQYLRHIERLRRAIFHMNQKSKDLRWLATLPKHLWRLLRNNQLTTEQLLEHYFPGNEPLKILLAANIGYFTDRPDIMSASHFAAAQGSYYAGGGHFIRGGSQAITDQLVRIVEQANGRVLTRQQVTQIHLKESVVEGVSYEKQAIIGKPTPLKESKRQQAFAPLVLANAAPAVVQSLLPSDQQPLVQNHYREQQTSTSLWVLVLGLDAPPSTFGINDYCTFVVPENCQQFSHYCHQNLHQSLFQQPHSTPPNNNLRVPAYSLTNYHQLDPELNHQGRYLITLTGVDQLAPWQQLDKTAYQQRKNSCRDRLIADLNQHFPGLAKAVGFSEMGTAKTMQSYLNTPDGAVYGYEQQPPFLKRRPPSCKTPIPGLYLASAFGPFGGGYTGAMLCGELAADEASRYLKRCH